MTKYFRIIVVLILSMGVFSNWVSGYLKHEPIIIESMPTTEDSPLIIEGLEITNPSGPCLRIHDVANVIVRNNYLHECGTEISLERQEEIIQTGKMSVILKDSPFDTGAAFIFDASGSVEVYNNRIENSDYGLLIRGHRYITQGVKVYNNTITGNHRNYHLFVEKANNIHIFDNNVSNNGLDIYFDNQGLMEAFSRGEDFPDGRTQAIRVHRSNNIAIYNNLIDNSHSDGIGVTADGGNNFAMGEDDSFTENIRISNNTVTRSNEQGLWFVRARNVNISNNLITENRHRPEEIGGSSGIMFEGGCSNVTLSDNEISYNDMYGIAITASSNITIENNKIHHNGDGAIFFMDLVHIQKEISDNIIVRENNISNNRGAVFGISTDQVGKVIVENNTFLHNGGTPMHFGFFDGRYDLPPENLWDYTDEEVIFKFDREAYEHQKNNFQTDIKINTAYGTLKEEKDMVDQSNDKEEKTGIAYLTEQLTESWKATLLVFFIICAIIGVLVYIVKKPKNSS